MLLKSLVANLYYKQVCKLCLQTRFTSFAYKTIFTFMRNKIHFKRFEKYYSQLAPETYSYTMFDRELGATRNRYKYWKKLEKSNLNNDFVYPYWEETRKRLGEYLLENITEGFLHYPLIQFNIGPNINGLTKMREWELKEISSRKNARLKFYKEFKESRVGEPIIDQISGFQNSVITCGSIDHLYYLSKILSQKKKIDNLIEFGGGYGNFSRVVRLYNPKITTTIIDLPEMLAFQNLFHRLNFPEVSVATHFSKPLRIQKGVLNLVPVWLVRELKNKPDVFLSTYALTETTDKLREEIAKLDFFKAKMIYLIGGKGGIYDSHQQMQRLVKEKRKKINISNFDKITYELIAW